MIEKEDSKKTGPRLTRWRLASMERVFTWDGQEKQCASVPDYAIADVVANGCTMPRIKRVEYSLKPAVDGKPATLATVVFFSDGTKSVAKNCPADPVEIEELKLEDGSTVQVASEASKERGLVYAVLKRLVSSLDEDGNLAGSGLGSSLRSLVAGAVDQNLAAAEKKAAKKKREASIQEAAAAAKPETGKEEAKRAGGVLEKFNAALKSFQAACHEAAGLLGEEVHG